MTDTPTKLMEDESTGSPASPPTNPPTTPQTIAPTTLPTSTLKTPPTMSGDTGTDYPLVCSYLCDNITTGFLLRSTLSADIATDYILKSV
jgi:hypothetical protein